MGIASLYLGAYYVALGALTLVSLLYGLEKVYTVKPINKDQVKVLKSEVEKIKQQIAFKKL